MSKIDAPNFQQSPDSTQRWGFKRYFARYRRTILALLLVLALLPFFALSFYNFPFWDDYWMAGLARRLGNWEAQHVHYMTWGGRFSLVFILTVFNPLAYDWMAGFRLTPLVMLGGTMIAAQAGFRELTLQRLPWSASLRWAAILLLLHLALMPTIYPSFYWFVGGTVYQLPIIMMLVVLIAGLRALRAHKTWIRCAWYATALLSTTCVVGLQELAILLLGWTLLLLLAVSWHNSHWRAVKCWGGLLFCAVIGGVVSILAPGNFIRAKGVLVHPQNVGQILGNAVEHLLVFLAHPNQILMLLLVPVLFGRLLLRVSPRRPIGFQLPFYIGVFFLIGGLVICYVFFAIISADGLPQRTVNFIWAWLFLGWILVLWSAIPEQPSRELRRTLVLIQKPIIALVMLLLLTGVQRRAWVEWLRNAPLFQAQQNQRLEKIRIAAKQGKHTVVVEAFNGFIPRHVAIIGEPLVSHENSASERHNNHVTAEWFGLDSVIVQSPMMNGKLSDDL